VNDQIHDKEQTMAHQADSSVIETVVQLLCENGLSHMADAMRLMLNEAMRIERSQVLEAAPYQRTEKRRGYANGFKAKTVSTRLGEMALEVPQVRGDVQFYPSALERGLRSERALKCAIAEMYVQGVSTRKVTEVMRELCGLDVSSTQVSRATKLLDEELDRWRNRPLGEVPYVFLDARYEKIRPGGSVISCAVLMAFGVDESGHRTVLGVSVSLSEVEVHWRDFFAQLQERGLSGVRLLISDDHAGLKAAREARFPGAPLQRCQFHLQPHGLGHMRKPVFTKQLNHSLNYARVSLVGHRLLLVMNLVVHKRKSNLARQNKSPCFVLALRSGSLPLAIDTAQNKTLSNCFGSIYRKKFTRTRNNPGLFPHPVLWR
jgi:transposase-like protein